MNESEQRVRTAADPVTVTSLWPMVAVHHSDLRELLRELDEAREDNLRRHGIGGELIIARAERDALAAKLKRCEAELDRVMLEHCPDEMSAEQRARWAEHQRAASEKEPRT